MYHGICMIYKYVNEGNISTVVNKFHCRVGINVPEAKAMLCELRDLKLLFKCFDTICMFMFFIL